MSKPDVVAGIDGSASSVRAAIWAGGDAARRKLPLRLVHAYTVPRTGMPEIAGSARMIREGMDQRGREWLAEAKTAVLAEYPGLTIEISAGEGNPVAALVRASRQARMLVLGSRGLGGFTGLLVGSTAVSLAAQASCPVVVARGRMPDDPPPTAGPVLVGVDGSPASEAAIEFACEEASLRRTGLTVVHTWNEVLTEDGIRRGPVDSGRIHEDESRLLAEQLAGWQEKYPDVPISRVVMRGRPVRTLLEFGDRAQLIVVGSRGRGGFKGMLLGSTSQALLAHSACPVAVVRPREVPT
ncbi:universal stress protein [Amycolatopsis sp. NPDC059657]|uniref:universal stress protein n=1 Tax=Amycolatopsis sp. NPDC059657 TaxID=3346899 RepID=UPI00366DFAC1